MSIRKGFFRLTLVVSIIVGIMAPCLNKLLLPRSSITVEFPEDWKSEYLQGKPKSIVDLLVKNSEFQKLSKMQQLNIKRQFEKDIRKIEYVLKGGYGKNLSSIRYTFHPRWRELSLLAFIGFASPWLIYLFIRWVIVAFIFRGFRGRSPKEREPDQP
ncbi:MAG TPA: hypothetical protein VLW47_09565 [Thermodesulfobacteriota bacterium]|nr:hypothetical protein [Thermodesulfobacteriota bacterium]